MRLPNDVSRCRGELPAGPCPSRDHCLRHTCKGTGPVPTAKGLCTDMPELADFVPNEHAPPGPLCRCWLAADGFVCRTPGKCNLEVT